MPNRELFQRHPNNPILGPRDWPYPVHSVFNPGATRLPDGSTLLLCRVEEPSGRSHLTAARSADGVKDWQIDPQPTFEADPERAEEAWGVEDARITYLAEMDRYVVAYTCHSESGPGVSLALTQDFKAFERLGIVKTPDNKDAAVFPRRIGERWALVHRPMTDEGSNVWIAFSDDLTHWSDDRPLIRTRSGRWWDSFRVGLSPPPIETAEGWIVLYHGVRRTSAGPLYRSGLVLLDLDDPTRCLLRGRDSVLGPAEPYERMGDIPNVVFPCGFTLDGDTINVYYGAADTCIGLAHASVDELLAWLHEHGEACD